MKLIGYFLKIIFLEPNTNIGDISSLKKSYWFRFKCFDSFAFYTLGLNVKTFLWNSFDFVFKSPFTFSVKILIYLPYNRQLSVFSIHQLIWQYCYRGLSFDGATLPDTEALWATKVLTNLLELGLSCTAGTNNIKRLCCIWFYFNLQQESWSCWMIWSA